MESDLHRIFSHQHILDCLGARSVIRINIIILELAYLRRTWKHIRFFQYIGALESPLLRYGPVIISAIAVPAAVPCAVFALVHKDRISAFENRSYARRKRCRRHKRHSAAIESFLKGHSACSMGSFTVLRTVLVLHRLAYEIHQVLFRQV